MSDQSMFNSLSRFQWARASNENPRLSAPITSTATTATVTNAPKDEDGAVIGGNFLMGIKDSNGYVESCYVPSGTLNYDAQSANFTVGKVAIGGTSGARGYIIADTDSGATGTLTLAFVTGTFQNDEALTDTATGSATVDGTLTNSVSTDGLTISNIVRGIDLAGLDLTTQNTAANAVAHNSDDTVTCQISAVDFTLMDQALKGNVASGGANWKIGREKDEDIKIYAWNGDADEPWWGYDSATSAFVYSNDGTSSTPFGTGAGVTGGDGITVTAGDIDIDLTDTTVFRDSRNGNEARVVVTAAADGLIAMNFLSANLNEANTFFGATDISGAEAETLTDGSDASALHTHGVAVQAGSGSASNINASGNLDIDVTPFDSGDVVRLDLGIYIATVNDDTTDASRNYFYQLSGLVGGEYGGWYQTNTSATTTAPVVWAAGNPVGTGGAWSVSCAAASGTGNTTLTLSAPAWSGNNIRIAYTFAKTGGAGTGLSLGQLSVGLTATKLG